MVHKKIDRLLSRRVASGPAMGMRLVRAGRCSGFTSGEYERPIQDFFQATLREGDVLVDVGANIGFFTLLGSRLVCPTGRVYSFEPIPENVSIIHRNLALNGMRNVAVYSQAVGSSVGTEDIWVTTHPGGATLASAGEVPGDALNQIAVAQVSLDHWMKSVDTDAIRLIKVDVEGAEQAVLCGVTNLLEKFKPILLIELDSPTPEGLEQKMEKLMQWCKTVDYKLERLLDSYDNLGYQVAHFVAEATDPYVTV